MPRGSSKSGAVELDIFLEKLQIIPASPAFNLAAAPVFNQWRVTNFVNPCASLNGFVSQSRSGFAYCMELFYIDYVIKPSNGSPLGAALESNPALQASSTLQTDFTMALDTIKYFIDTTVNTANLSNQIMQSPTNIDYTTTHTFGFHINVGKLS